MRWRIAKVTAVVVLCCLLSGCEFFCMCAAILTSNKVDLENINPQNPAPNPLLYWLYLFVACAGAEDTSDHEICPSTGQQESESGEFTACIPGTIVPEAPSLLAPEALLPGPADPSQAEVESAIFIFPQGGRRLRRSRARSPGNVDCTDPANAGRGLCGGSNRENKPLGPPQN